MNRNQALAIAMLCVATTFASAQTAIFDWDEVETGTEWWNGYGYVESDGDLTLLTGGRAASWKNDDTGEGFALKASYAQDLEPATFQIDMFGDLQTFAVDSIDISANGAGGEFTPIVQGFFGTIEQWSIAPEGEFATYDMATSGDLSLGIDQIVWNTGEASNPDGTFGNNIDNLIVSITEPPAPPEPPADAITFDWDDIIDYFEPLHENEEPFWNSRQWWRNYGYQEERDGFTLVTGGRAAASLDPDVGESIALKASYEQDSEPATFDVQVDGELQTFSVFSIDISANNAGGEITPTVQGILGGEQQWLIEPQANGSLASYFQANEGDLAAPIDQILWNTGVASDPDNTFGNNIDNLVIFIADEPTCVPGNGDIDGNGQVEFADFLIMSTNFGQAADSAGGDIDCNGTVEFADFLVLSNVFGQAVGAETSLVPEPNASAMLFMALTVFSISRKTRN